MEKTYYMINVEGKNGYSFMVSSKRDDLLSCQVLAGAQELGLFQDEDDEIGANVVVIDNEDDINHFKECGCLYELTF